MDRASAACRSQVTAITYLGANTSQVAALQSQIAANQLVTPATGHAIIEGKVESTLPFVVSLMVHREKSR